MQKLIIFLLLLTLGFGAHAQVAAANEDVEFKEMAFDFGKIPQGKPVYHTFVIINKSDKAIKLEDVQAACGCTTPEWTKGEIPPGGNTKIKVGYNSASEGYFDKTISVTYNGGMNKQLHIKGTVWKIPPGPAPANASVQFLKQQTL